MDTGYFDLQNYAVVVWSLSTFFYSCCGLWYCSERSKHTICCLLWYRKKFIEIVHLLYELVYVMVYRLVLHDILLPYYVI